MVLLERLPLRGLVDAGRCHRRSFVETSVARRRLVRRLPSSLLRRLRLLRRSSVQPARGYGPPPTSSCFVLLRRSAPQAGGAAAAGHLLRPDAQLLRRGL